MTLDSDTKTFDHFELRSEHFIHHLIESGGLRSIIVCAFCLFIVITVGAFIIYRMYFQKQSTNNNNKNSSSSSLESRRQEYEKLLGHIRALETLKHERELLTKRTLRVVTSWKHFPNNAASRLTSTSPVHFSSISEISENVKDLKRDHQLTMTECRVVLGERDTADVFVSSSNSSSSSSNGNNTNNTSENNNTFDTKKSTEWQKYSTGYQKQQQQQPQQSVDSQFKKKNMEEGTEGMRRRKQARKSDRVEELE